MTAEFAKVLFETEEPKTAKNGASLTSSKDLKPSSNWKKLSKELGITSNSIKKKLIKTHIAASIADNNAENVPEPFSTKTEIQNLFNTYEKSNLEKKAGKYVALDCEFVGIGASGEENALARVSVVNFHGAVLLDLFVKPRQTVTDFRTQITGIDATDMETATSLEEALSKVYAVLKDKTIIGHSLKHDFKVLRLDHPHRMTRDTSKYRPFRAVVNGKTPSLRRLAAEILGLKTFQAGAHSSVEDAQVAMLLYRRHRKDWETHLGRR